MTLDLQTRLESLWGLERRHLKPDLDGTRDLLAGLGHPEARFASVHVAGTNGKGSVCALIERVLRAAGHRTGLYTSPHLVDFRERIRVNGRWASEAALGTGLDAIERLPHAGERTFFEVATALAFDHFAREQVWIGIGRAVRCVMNVVKLADRGDPRQRHLEKREARCRVNFFRSEAVRSGVHLLAPCPEAVSGVM